MHDAEDKLWWCEQAGQWERRFVRRVAPRIGLDARLNPDKQDSPYVHDLFVDGRVADLKYRQTPFFTAGRYGLDAQFTVTLNKKDYERYREEYPGISIYFWVDWKQTKMALGARVRRVSPMTGLWVAPLPSLAQFVHDGRAPLHSYKRRVDDQRGNAKSSFLLDLRWLECLWMDTTWYQHASVLIPFSTS